ncbi:nucleoside deaminase [Schleiferilactobacillus perolens]|jgi:guanine deaminase|uniref:Guanine deaminase n=1 Tax=Schleiferilactobacillus perolens DSM 12744 TaxID=1423792 RepID=A0A0R1N220_9LACO|nr:nucleoside deaminase [Schleiferilactobacillus perolens]KRL14285.1 guanine deaminase [Schleiferilactobacillus perolens DSM 12744]MCI1891390.1 nucleoside deaminase [Schleiferilactobacillus harbinensis]MCI1914049.1 nucleoside deaminase [Schleiferilactobacillus harbinensis]MCI2170711.1 nucleoside deaminase [Schleiferilactobacillus perolens]
MAYEQRFMKIAAAQAELNNELHEGGPFGCVIVKDGKIVGKGHNQVLFQHDPTAHGEIVTIRQACETLDTYDLTGCELYTSAYPCPMCLGAIMWANIKTVYYGNAPADATKIGFRDDFMYDFIKGGQRDSAVLNLEQHDRDITQPSFVRFAQDANAQLY